MGTKPNCEGCITVGPWGSSIGEDWFCLPEGVINKITIKHEENLIYCIQFQCDNGTGKAESFSFGESTSSTNRKTDTICIDYPNEYLVSISGSLSDTYFFLRSLCFVTNRKIYGPYGLGKTGSQFLYEGKDGMIVGFHGRASTNSVTAIGIYVMPESLAFGDEKSVHEFCASCISRMVMPKEAVGPWGASKGKHWDDGVFSTVKQIHVFLDESLKVICAIQFVYVKKDSELTLSLMHGGSCKDKLKMVNLDGMDEYLTRISGFYGPVEGFNGMEAITSITFHTNKTKYGPFGEESGDGYTYFTSTKSPGKVVGFHGRKCSGLLTAIGVHMEYF